MNRILDFVFSDYVFLRCMITETNSFILLGKLDILVTISEGI